jgi:hypothetical protein
MIHVAQNTGVSVPKVFAYYTYGPIHRKIDNTEPYMVPISS